MKKRLMLAVMMLLCVLLLSGCKETQKYDLKTSNNGGAAQTQQQQKQQTAQSNPSQDEYDPRTEEDYAQEYPSLTITTATPAPATPAPTVRSEYAGATPVILDPIDKPTPTPVPGLNVTYADYDATKLRLSFQAPAGWTIDDSDSSTYTIQNPDSRMDYFATLTIRAEKVTSDYSTSSLKDVVENMLKAIGTAAFKDYNPSRTDTRSLLGKTGVYANYDGVLEGENGDIRIAGRVHAVCVDKVLYTLHLTAPYAQWNDYKEKVYDHLRDTIMISK